MDLVEAGPVGHRYPAVAGGDRDTVAACLGVLDVVDDTGAIVVATSQGEATSKLGPWITAQRKAGRGIAVQMPDLQAVGFANDPLRIACEPPADWVMTVAVLATESLNEAQAMLSTPSSFVLAPPASGWVETRGPLSGYGWGHIAAAGALVAVGGYLLLR